MPTDKLKEQYSKRLPVADDLHQAITEMHNSTGVPIYRLTDTLLRLALRVKRIPLRGEVKAQ